MAIDDDEREDSIYDISGYDQFGNYNNTMDFSGGQTIFNTSYSHWGEASTHNPLASPLEKIGSSFANLKIGGMSIGKDLVTVGLLAAVEAATGIPALEIAGTISQMMAEGQVAINFNADVKKYGWVDATRNFVANAIPVALMQTGKMIPSIADKVKELVEPYIKSDTVLADITTGVGIRRMSGFESSDKSETRHTATAHDTWIAAHIADQSYKPVKSRDRSFYGYYYDKATSDKNVAIYEDGVGGIIIGLRGTDFTDARDLGTDFSIATKSLFNSEQYRTTISRIERLIHNNNQAYGNDGNIVLSGHSLAGALVNGLMSNPEIASSVNQAHSFAPGGSPGILTNLGIGDAGNEGDNPYWGDAERALEASGHNVDHLYQHITGSGDILSMKEYHSPFGSIDVQEHHGHSEWDDWLSLDWWKQRYEDEDDMGGNYGIGEMENIEEMIEDDIGDD